MDTTRSVEGQLSSDSVTDEPIIQEEINDVKFSIDSEMLHEASMVKKRLEYSPIPEDSDKDEPNEADANVSTEIPTEVATTGNLKKNMKFVVYALGIFVLYFYYAILQEKIMKGKYPEETTNADGTITYTTFTYSLSLVFIQCIVSYVSAKVAIWLKKETMVQNTELLYSGTALTYVLAMVGSNMALQWVSYPTQVIGKSAKPIPVLILGVLVGKRSYAIKKYFFVFVMVVGVVLFMYKDQSDKNETNETTFGLGELLLIFSLIMDGLTGGLQEVMRSTTNPSGVQMMSAMNFWSCIYLAIGLVVKRESLQFCQFVMKYPFVLANIAILAIVGSFGQHFIYLMVHDFGSLPVSIVTTTRKFFTLLGSVLIFGNTLVTRQWIGAVTVFGALFLDIYYSNSKRNTNQETNRNPIN